MEKFPQTTEVIVSLEPTEEELMNDNPLNSPGVSENNQWAQAFAQPLGYPQFDFQGYGIPDNPYWFNQTGYDAQYSQLEWNVSQEQQSQEFSQNLATEQLEFKEGDSELSPPQEVLGGEIKAENIKGATPSDGAPGEVVGEEGKTRPAVPEVKNLAQNKEWTPDMPPSVDEMIANFRLLAERAPDEVQKAFFMKVVESFKDESNFLGNGVSGRVYQYATGEESPEKVCAKLVYYPESYRNKNIGIHPRDEYTIQEEIWDSAHNEQARFPRPIKFISCGGDYFVNIMEELPAVNLLAAMEGSKEFPATFDYNEFCIELRRLVNQVHSAGYIHNDLYPRNIMIDTETGRPYIIDFGRAEAINPMDKSPRMRSIKNRDFDRINELHEKFLIMFER